MNHSNYMNYTKKYSGVLPENEILLGDSLELLASLPDRSVDMVFADPPYNLQLSGELRRPNDSRVDGVKRIGTNSTGLTPTISSRGSGSTSAAAS